MNYLAHFLLAAPQARARVGQMLGDFHKGAVDALADPVWRREVQLHRAIDRYTDTHPRVLAVRGELSAPLRRYGGIVLDVYFDHCLARDWTRWCAQPLSEFVAEVHAALLADYAQLPPRMRGSIDYLISTQLLLAYREFSGVARALTGIASRLRRPSPLPQAAVELRTLDASLNAAFVEFFPQLQEFVNEWRNTHSL
ncbi:ACP phosphodiesterase [Plasticicumulans acidivorans]|uniref:Acyl carrier protein phosphodiesterase n=1 Tax=Plasticicumulans acidivorans TaxID=886464 RepID=A0A317MY65_9GAMM|nr:ACP phosphodiesterase [Plasticicumulans acidivorans]PWV63454.1 acyl carrier protein phosphodiesterase [Plasticicumulans acidivorans]